MLARIIRDHNDYIDRSKASRTFLTMMTKIRAAQSLGSALCCKGNHKRGYELYRKTIQEILSKQIAQHFSKHHLDILQEATDISETVETMQEKAWSLRSSIDIVYDACINDLNEVENQRPANFHLQIKDVLNEASPYVSAGNYHEGLSKYTSLLKRFRSNTRFKGVVSAGSLNMINDIIEFAGQSDELEVSVKKAREGLDNLYNEIRLPDLYLPNNGPQAPLEPKKAYEMRNKLLVTDFRRRDGSLFAYNLQAVDDKIMGGRSESNIELDVDEKYLKFFGSVSRINSGGFASFRIVPIVKEELKKILTNVKGISIEVKLICCTNKRFKFQLANEAHLKSFNWQSEFVLEPGDDFKHVYLDILSFWPTMFGHVLSSPGNVEFQKVDCCGIILSHVTVDGKENPDFCEGEFGLAVRSISLVKEMDSDI